MCFIKSEFCKLFLLIQLVGTLSCCSIVCNDKYKSLIFYDYGGIIQECVCESNTEYPKNLFMYAMLLCAVNDANCKAKAPTASKPGPITLPEKPKISESQCKNSGYNYSSHGCHKVQVNSTVGVTWDDAELACQDDGSKLAIIKDAIETTYWFNLLMSKGVDKAWVGVAELKKYPSVTVDGKVINIYEHPYLDYPVVAKVEASENRQKPCLAFFDSKDGGGMTEPKCSEKIQAYICEKL